MLCGLGIVRHSFVFHTPANIFLEDSVGASIELQGLIVVEPDVRENSVRLTVSPDTSHFFILDHDVTQSTNFTKSTGFTGAKNERPGTFLKNDKILVVMGLEEHFSYGDVVSLSGTLQKPKNFETDTGREFDYISYLQKDGIRYQMYIPKIQRISQGQGNMLKSALFHVKRVFVESLGSVLPEPHASLAAGVLLGAKNSLGKELEDSFRKSGLIHIVVLSGYNVSIVAHSIVSLFSRLPLLIRVGGGTFGIALFALITGAGATVVRASIMAVLVLIARSTGRTYDTLRALFLAAAIMVFHNPLILMSDPSFQLSCMATFSLVVLSPHVERWLYFLPQQFSIKTTVASTIATQLFLLPLLIYMTGMVSIVSLITNLLVLLTIPLTMLTSFITGIVSLVSQFAGAIVGYGSYILLEYIFTIVEISVLLPFAYIELPPFPSWLMYTSYVLFFLWLWKVGGIVSRGEEREKGRPEEVMLSG